MAALTVNKKSILAVDDEPKILEAVASYLESKGYVVHTAENGQSALDIFESRNIALVVLDLMMPGISGEEVCTQIRKKSRVPILILTAKVDEADHLSGLSIGADDYVTKPFSLKVLAARVDALLRRSADDLVPLAVRNSWRDGDLVVDFEQNAVRKRGVAINLTPSERRILSALIKYPSKVFTREELIEIAFGDDFDGFDRVIDTHVKNLRKKIEDSMKSPVYVLTVHGLGYKFGGE
ncbi:MAG: response regulator transcription factor [Synergistaceae bacterium]|jgi:DNA-binding response OmpR family regulator|nr:response regulator transcription factor [Synergistaceae bacterium]